MAVPTAETRTGQTKINIGLKLARELKSKGLLGVFPETYSRNYCVDTTTDGKLTVNH
jgi:hypothetical protein